MNERILRIIRETNPTRCVIIGGVGDNADRLAKDLQVPDDPYIIATYHCYDPWFFASGNRAMPRKPSGVPSRRKPITCGPWIAQALVRPPQGAGLSWRMGHQHQMRTQVPAGILPLRSRSGRGRGFSDAIWDDGGDMWIYDRKSHRWNTDILQAVFPAASPTKLSGK